MPITHTTGDDANSFVSQLIEINMESARGFETAANSLKEGMLASMLKDLSRQRIKFADELKMQLENAAPNRDLSVDATSLVWHPCWDHLKMQVSTDGDYGFLVELERCEDALRRHYEAVLTRAAAGPVYDLLVAHLMAVKTGHNRIRDLRDIAREIS